MHKFKEEIKIIMLLSAASGLILALYLLFNLKGIRQEYEQLDSELQACDMNNVKLVYDLNTCIEYE